MTRPEKPRASKRARKHANEGRFRITKPSVSCMYCGLTFTKQANLDRHNANVHVPSESMLNVPIVTGSTLIENVREKMKKKATIYSCTFSTPAHSGNV
jgi:hypothetical protein